MKAQGSGRSVKAGGDDTYMHDTLEFSGIEHACLETSNEQHEQCTVQHLNMLKEVDNTTTSLYLNVHEKGGRCQTSQESKEKCSSKPGTKNPGPPLSSLHPVKCFQPVNQSTPTRERMGPNSKHRRSYVYFIVSTKSR